MSDRFTALEKAGGTAFPASLPLENGATGDWPGMTLRDWFAGQALAAIVQADGIQYAGNSKSWGQHAAMAYAHADAMLAERLK